MYCSILSNHAVSASHCYTVTIKAPSRQFLCGSLGEIIPVMTTQHDKLRYDVKFRILRLLQDNPEMTKRELAKEAGVSTGGIHYVLNALVEKGMLKLSNFTAAEDKRRYAYVLTPKGIAAKADLTRLFLMRKMAEYEAIKSEIEELVVTRPILQIRAKEIYS